MPFVKNTAIEESARCLLCLDAPCTKACPCGAQPDRFIRSLRFDNLNGAKAFVKNCAECSAPCMTACTRAKIDRAVEIKQTAEYIASAAKDTEPKADLSMTFCGLKCENPFFLSSSVVASGYDMCAKALDMGWAGIVYKTIGFAKMNEVSPRFDILNKETTPYIGFKNLEQISDHPLEENLAILKKLKENYPTKIIVSSIMGESEDEWTALARLSEEAGVDMIECNFSCPQMTSHSMGSDVGTNPELVAKYTAAVRRGTKLPVLAKMSPNITNTEIPAIAAVNAGAQAQARRRPGVAINAAQLVLLTAPAIGQQGPGVLPGPLAQGHRLPAVGALHLRHAFSLIVEVQGYFWRNRFRWLRVIRSMEFPLEDDIIRRNLFRFPGEK